jgi:hypothetical protein
MWLTVMCSLDRKSAFCDVALRRIANGSAVNERVAQGNSSQFNSLDFVSCGSGPGGRRFKSFRPDHFLQLIFMRLTRMG